MKAQKYYSDGIHFVSKWLFFVIIRNSNLVDIFARMKFMDRCGSGFDKIVNGTNRLFNVDRNHVELYPTLTHFSVVICNANYDAQNTSLEERGINLIKEYNSFTNGK